MNYLGLMAQAERSGSPYRLLRQAAFLIMDHDAKANDVSRQDPSSISASTPIKTLRGLKLEKKFLLNR